jgi:PHP family Zn ribbon phosphoesterase
MRAEFHVHTVLSACAVIEMIPPLIVREALEKQIDILAVTDHNSTLNAPAIMKAAEGTPLTVLPGMELHTREEVHVLCIFENMRQANEFQEVVDQHYAPGENNEDVFGPQYVVDHTGDFIRYEKHLLNQATQLSIDEAWQHVHRLGGLFIPAHIQRSLYGILPTLGFLPGNIPFSALEISRNYSFEKALSENPSIKGFTFIRNGDAHDLEAIRGYNILTIANPSLNEIGLALQKLAGRSVDAPPDIC